MNTQHQNAQYFNFTADAVAYLNEIKVIDVNGYQTLAIKGCIIEGKDGKSKSPVDLLVRGKQAEAVIESLEDWWPLGYNSGTSEWFAGIRIGSIKAKPYVSKKDGQAKATLSARLIAFNWLKIDKQDVEVPEWRTTQETPDVDDGEDNDTVGQPAIEKQQYAKPRPQAQGLTKAQAAVQTGKAGKPAVQGNMKAVSQPKKPLPKKVA